MQTTAVRTWEYKNDFFSIVIRESEHRPGNYIFFSGISMPKFDPICWGKTGICSNPAFKGLQLLRADVSHFAIKQGIVTKNAGIPLEPGTGHGHGWYQEDALLLENASPEAAQEILEFSARNLVQTVLNACHPDVKVPAGPLDPEAMQRFLESLSIPNYREMAPPPIAKPQAA
jgi:hypothetical protein